MDNLSAHELLMMLHQAKNHGDSTRQRGARQQAKDRRFARKAKRAYVPLCFVDPTVYIEEYEPWGEDWFSPYRRWRPVRITPTGRLDVRQETAWYDVGPAGWRRHEPRIA